jgi:acyl carrier protein
MDDRTIRDRLKQMIVKRLGLKIGPDEIKDDAPLFRDGLGLDSVESLELVVGIEEEFGVVVEDSPAARERFFSVATLAAYIGELLAKVAGQQVSA